MGIGPPADANTAAGQAGIDVVEPVFAGLRVRDFAAARAWYDKLLGEPAFLPHETEAAWTPADEVEVALGGRPA